MWREKFEAMEVIQTYDKSWTWQMAMEMERSERLPEVLGSKTDKT